MDPKRITFCPRCLKPVEAKEFFSSFGFSDWRSDTLPSTIRCSKCGYTGLPVEADISEYRKSMEKKG